MFLINVQKCFLFESGHQFSMLDSTKKLEKNRNT